MITRNLVIPAKLFTALVCASIMLAGCSGGGGGTSTLPNSAVAPGSGSVGLGTSSNTSSVGRAQSGGSTYASVVLADSAQAYYQLNDTMATVTDSGPSALSGSYGSGITHGSGTLTTGGVSASGFNGGMVYDPTMFVTIPPNSKLMPAKLTLETWIKAGQSNLPKKYLPVALYGRYLDGARFGFFITPQNGIMYTQKNVGLAAVYATSKSTIVPGKVFHCVATSDGTTVKLYINGALEKSVAYAGLPDYKIKGGEGLYIGGALNSGLASFNGSIAQLAIYSGALSAAQVLNHFVAGTAPTVVTLPPPGGSAYTAAVLADSARAYYQLNNTTSTVMDSGPNAINGIYGSGIAHGLSPLTTGGVSASGFSGGMAYDPTMFVTIPPNTNLMPAKLTLEAWIKAGQNNLAKKYLPVVLYGRYVDGSRYGFFITPQNGIQYTQRNVGHSAMYAVGKSTIVPGKVFHCVATSDGTTVKLYVNGGLEASVPYTGSPDYHSVSGGEGLYVGGALNSGLASFNGSVAQVAVYGSALSAAAVLNHFVAGQLAPLASEAALSSDGFVDSIGVNTHFTDYASLYGTHYAQTKAALTALGVRHIRDGMFAQKNAAEVQEYHDLGAAGIHGLFTTSLSLNQATIQSFPSLVGSMFEAYEAPNEQDAVGNANWLTDCTNYQKSLYAWVKGNAATAQYRVVGPVLVNTSSYSMVGNLSAYMDNGNVHDYMNPRNPGTTGWGSVTPYGTYGSIDYNLNVVKVTSAGKPVIATETGYGTTIPGTIDNRTMLRYIPRLFFEQINHGIVRTYTYEFLDDGGDGTRMFQTFGLVQHNFTPKPAYTALKSLISELSDPGSSFKTSPLSYQLVGNTNNVLHTLMQKRNGSYILALWIETPSWDLSGNGADIIVPAQTMTVNTGATFAKATISTFDESGNLTTAPLAWSGTGATFNLNDKVSLVTITP